MTTPGISWASLASPIGPLLAARDAVGLTHLYLPEGRHQTDPAPAWVRDDSVFDDVRTQFEEYFAGTRTVFELPLHPTGTPFQLRVWDALTRIPFGETVSYGHQAAVIGAPTAVRAVGAANGRNPISIIVPCHRVVGANGSLTGYGGGLPAKQWLLAHEGRRTGLFAL